MEIVVLGEGMENDLFLERQSSSWEVYHHGGEETQLDDGQETGLDGEGVNLAIV